jgi:VCBS repeat-containing protein
MAAASPTAVDDTATVSEDDPFTPVDVLANDTDPDGAPMVVESVDTSATSGQVRIGSGIDRPNIVLIVTDDQSFESVAKMPYLSSRSGWYRFDSAFINNATCCPSRATILTGQWSHHHGVETTGGAPRFDDSSTLATWLDGAGYRTGFVGKHHLGTSTTAPQTYIPPGWDDWHAFAKNTPGWYYDYTLNENGTLVNYGSDPEDYSTDVLAAKALDFIEQPDAAPFFLYLAPRAPHNNWTPAPRHVGAFANAPVAHMPDFNEADMSDKPGYWQNLGLLKERDNDGARRKQWATLLAVDDMVKSIVDALEQQGVMDDTVLVFMTDNGYAFAEHRHDGKVCAYDVCSRTPLLVSYLGHDEGYVFPELIGNEDLAPTLADLAGVTPTTYGDGDSFASMLRTGQAPADWPDEVLLRGYRPSYVTSEPPEFWGIRTREYKYILTVPTGEVELYDLAADPFELDNVAGHPDYATIEAELGLRLAELKSRPAGTMDVSGAGTSPDNEAVSYRPAADYCNDPDPAASDTFTYTLNDGPTATVSVTVMCVEDPPIARNDLVSVTEDDPAIAIDVLVNDTDVDGGLKVVESVDLTAVDGTATRGDVTITNFGADVTYEPPPGYCNDAASGPGSGPDDTFNYTLNDGSTATVYVEVSCVDDLPVAVADSKTVIEDSGFTAINVRGNDTDVDGGPKLVASLDTTGTHGAVAITNSGVDVSYEPPADYCNRPGSGPLDSFTYTLNGASTATVSVTVSCVDDFPIAVADSTTVTEDSVFVAIDVRGNDTDVDGGPKLVTSVDSTGTHGAVAITNAGAAVSYEPVADYCNDPDPDPADPAPDDTFTYTLNGGSTATASVTVTCVGDPPVAVNDSKAVTQGSGFTVIDVLANDADVDGGTRSVRSVDRTGTNGTVKISRAGSGVRYQPPAGYCNDPDPDPAIPAPDDTFTYTLNGGSTATVSVTVRCAAAPEPT